MEHTDKHIDKAAASLKRPKRKRLRPGLRLYVTVFVISFFLGLVVTGVYLMVADIHATVNRLL